MGYHESDYTGTMEVAVSVYIAYRISTRLQSNEIVKNIK